MGTFTKNTHRHESVSMSSPPTTGPSAGASAVGMIRIREAAARRSGGKARKSIARPTGVNIPPPTPWRTRKAMSSPSEVDKPHRHELTVNTISANWNVRFVPNRSPIQPDAGIHTARLSRYPVTTHSIDAVGTSNSAANVGRATLTIVMSMMLTNMAAT